MRRRKWLLCVNGKLFSGAGEVSDRTRPRVVYKRMNRGHERQGRRHRRHVSAQRNTRVSYITAVWWLLLLPRARLFLLIASKEIITLLYSAVVRGGFNIFHHPPSATRVVKYFSLFFAENKNCLLKTFVISSGRWHLQAKNLLIAKRGEREREIEAFFSTLSSTRRSGCCCWGRAFVTSLPPAGPLWSYWCIRHSACVYNIQSMGGKA